ncbi:J domain-containing protein [Nocardioides mangrovicus]|uniref:J domain-containing protein n=1 Tax=Nocardioides mangrovicus TaxID=2478913 RepID=UPI001314C126|nr:DnaJ domain-containing protein [Nocardioides mangrovicus]
MTSQRAGATWYDLLGVDRDATPDQIKAAWRDATDRFEPGSGTSQFRLFNEAADVLLDPAQRAAYDAGLEREPVAAPVDVRDPESTTALAPSPQPTLAPTPEPAEPGEQESEEAERTDAAEESEEAEEAEEAGRTEATTGRRLAAVPLWVLALLTVVVVAVVAIGAVLAVRNHDAGQSDDAGQEASAAAERALPAVLSYDYRRLKADNKRADAYLTPTYRKEYDATFAKLIEADGTTGPAVQTKAVVKATVQNVGVVSAEADRVRVIAFVNQTTTKGDASPTLALNRLTISMKRSGDSWLVDGITSY